MSDRQTEAILEQLKKKSAVAARVGRYVGAQDGRALVDMGDQRFAVPFKSAGFVPQINESVWIESIDDQMFMTGPTAPKPGIGVVLTITGATAVVRTDFGDFPMVVAPTDPMPSSGDSVGISWSSGPWCILLIDVPAEGEAPPDPGGGAGTVRVAEFRAIDAGSTDRGSARWWQAQPWSSATTYGAWFYGTQIKDTIPAGAVFESLEFYVSWAVRRYGGSRFALHTSPTKAGVPAMGAYTVWDPPEGWQTPPDPAGWFAELKAGGGSFGVGLNQGGYEQFRSLAQDGLSGALRIKWR